MKDFMKYSLTELVRRKSAFSLSLPNTLDEYLIIICTLWKMHHGCHNNKRLFPIMQIASMIRIYLYFVVQTISLGTAWEGMCRNGIME